MFTELYALSQPFYHVCAILPNKFERTAVIGGHVILVATPLGLSSQSNNEEIFSIDSRLFGHPVECSCSLRQWVCEISPSILLLRYQRPLQYTDRRHGSKGGNRKE
jgi:hypothetical protein